MDIRVVGRDSEALAVTLRRHCKAEVRSGPGGDDAEYVCVAVGDLPETDLLLDPRLQLLVLVEPGLALRDRMLRALAGQDHPALEIVEHVRPALQAERTWSLIGTLVHGVPAAVQALENWQTVESQVVEGPPSVSTWTALDQPVTLASLQLGLLGFGLLGQHLALRAAQAGMQVRYWLQHATRSDVIEADGAALQSGARPATFDDLLAGSGIVVLDLVYEPDSIRSIDAPEIALLRRDAWLVNTSHGRAIDEGALLQALRGGHLAGVALDRFNYEPLPGDSPLRTQERVLLTPGIAVPDETTVMSETARRVSIAIASHFPQLEKRTVRRITREIQR